MFILVALFALDLDVFVDNLSAEGLGSLFDQVRGTMLATVFVFLGVEGASVYSRYAQRREHVGRATVLGFLSVLAVFATVTIVSYGILPRAEIAELRQPSGRRHGGGRRQLGQRVRQPRPDRVGARRLPGLDADGRRGPVRGGQGRRHAPLPAPGEPGRGPVAALLMSTALIQVMLFVTLVSEDAFNFMLNMTSALTLIPFLLAAAYAEAGVRPGEGQGGSRTRELRAGLATLYTAFLLFAAGPKYMLVSFIIYAPGSILFVMARREQGRAFSPVELVILAVSVIGAVIGVIALDRRWITV